MNKEVMENYLRSKIELYYSIATDDYQRDAYRIRCYGVVKGFQMTLAMLCGDIVDVKPIEVNGELVR